MESSGQFERRKEDHIRLALDPRTQARGQSGLDRIRLIHEALPELNFDEIQLQSDYWGHSTRVPLFISSMTAGHTGALDLNIRLAKAAEKRGWAMGVGSQRRELTDPSAQSEWQKVRSEAPNALLFGNLGIAQIITTPVEVIQALIQGLGAQGLFVHLNPLQECLQPEGTPQFRGGTAKLRDLCASLTVPVIVKEVGTGISQQTVKRLADVGAKAVDVAGLGGTHWGRLEGYRSAPQTLQAQAAQTFADWGISTLESMLEAKLARVPCQIWGSGGVRSGLDAAKLFALGADKVGVAQPVLQAALESDERLNQVMETMEFELKVALFCTGSLNLSELRTKGVWRWN